jgi:hypothetical protein
MQGAERADRQLLDAAALVGHLVPDGSVFAFHTQVLGKLAVKLAPPEPELQGREAPAGK